MRVDGGCLCGQVSYEAEVDPARVAICHCTDCGTRIHAHSPGDAEAFFGLRVGTVNQRALLVPRVQVWCQSAQPWVATLDEIPRRAQQD